MQRLAFLRTTGAVMLFCALSAAHGQSFRSIQIPRSPTSYDECTALAREFEDRANEIRARNRECMNEPADRWGNRACSRPIYDEDIRNSRESVEAKQECNHRVRAYLEQQRQEEEARREEQRRREHEMAEQRERREREMALGREASREAAERSEHRAEQKAELGLAIGAINATVKAGAFATLANTMIVNPFKDSTDLKPNNFFAAKTLAGGSPSSAIVGAAVNSVMPESHSTNGSNVANPGATAAEIGGAVGFNGNPFRGFVGANPVANEVSGASLVGVKTLTQRALDQFDTASASAASLGANPFQLQPPSPTFRATPIGSGIPGSGSLDVSAAPSPASAVETSYQDPSTGTSISIPPGYVLYRDPSSGTLSAVNYAQVAESATGGDQSNLGAQGCSASGIGIVTPICEQQRRAASNPFTPK